MGLCTSDLSQADPRIFGTHFVTHREDDDSTIIRVITFTSDAVKEKCVLMHMSDYHFDQVAPNRVQIQRVLDEIKNLWPTLGATPYLPEMPTDVRRVQSRTSELYLHEVSSGGREICANPFHDEKWADTRFSFKPASMEWSLTSECFKFARALQYGSPAGGATTPEGCRVGPTIEKDDESSFQIIVEAKRRALYEQQDAWLELMQGELTRRRQAASAHDYVDSLKARARGPAPGPAPLWAEIRPVLLRAAELEASRERDKVIRVITFTSFIDDISMHVNDYYFDRETPLRAEMQLALDEVKLAWPSLRDDAIGPCSQYEWDPIGALGTCLPFTPTDVTSDAGNTDKLYLHEVSDDGCEIYLNAYKEDSKKDDDYKKVRFRFTPATKEWSLNSKSYAFLGAVQYGSPASGATTPEGCRVGPTIAKDDVASFQFIVDAKRRALHEQQDAWLELMEGELAKRRQAPSVREYVDSLLARASGPALKTETLWDEIRRALLRAEERSAKPEEQRAESERRSENSAHTATTTTTTATTKKSQTIVVAVKPTASTSGRRPADTENFHPSWGSPWCHLVLNTIGRSTMARLVSGGAQAVYIDAWAAIVVPRGISAEPIYTPDGGSAGLVLPGGFAAQVVVQSLFAELTLKLGCMVSQIAQTVQSSGRFGYVKGGRSRVLDVGTHGQQAYASEPLHSTAWDGAWMYGTEVRVLGFTVRETPSSPQVSVECKHVVRLQPIFDDQIVLELMHRNPAHNMGMPWLS